jgi:hypothetical protein
MRGGRAAGSGVGTPKPFRYPFQNAFAASRSIAVGARQRRRDLVAAREGLDEAEDLVQDQRERAAVEERVVEGPHHRPVVVGLAEQRDAGERRVIQREAAAPILAQERADPRLDRLGREAAQILLREGDRRLVVHHLLRLAGAREAERGAQDRVPIGHALPRLAERGRVDPLMERADHLLDVHARLRGHEAVEHHPLLHRGEGICGFDLRPAHGLFVSSGKL